MVTMEGAKRPGVGELVGPEVVRHLEGDVRQEALSPLGREVVIFVEPRARLAPARGSVVHAAHPQPVLIFHQADDDLRESSAEVGLETRHEPVEDVIRHLLILLGAPHD